MKKVIISLFLTALFFCSCTDSVQRCSFCEKPAFENTHKVFSGEDGDFLCAECALIYYDYPCKECGVFSDDGADGFCFECFENHNGTCDLCGGKPINKQSLVDAGDNYYVCADCMSDLLKNNSAFHEYVVENSCCQ